MSNGELLRLVKAVKRKHPHLSLRVIEGLIQKGLVLVDGKARKKSFKVSEQAEIVIPPQLLKTDLQANPDLNCDILFEDKNFLFINKPGGLHSVALDFLETQSVANWLIAKDPELAKIDPLDCGLAHRLDKETSGVLVAGKTFDAYAEIRNAFTLGSVAKIYQAITTEQAPLGVHQIYARNHPKKRGQIQILEEAGDKTHAIATEVLACEPHALGFKTTIHLITGFRHQIRAHLAHLGAPLLGDTVYGGQEAKRLHLHAERLHFKAFGKTYDVTAVCPF